MKLETDRLEHFPAATGGASGKGVYDPMSNMKNAPEMTAAPKTGAEQKDASALVKKIVKTTYVVRVHFSETSKETMSDKIKRMLKNEVEQM